MHVRFWQGLFYLALAVATWGFLKDVSGVPSQWMPNDKVMHVLIFVVLGSLWHLGFGNATSTRLLGFVALAAYGALIEVLQGMTPVRSADPWDWLADTLGLVIAQLLSQPFQKWRRQ